MDLETPLSRRGRVGRVLAAALSALAIGGATMLSAQAGGEVNVYSYRKEHLIRPLLDAFTEATGIEVNLVSIKADALLERLKSEGANSPADILLTADASRLWRAREADVLQPVRSSVLEGAIPPQYRDPEGYWFGLSVRARVLFHARDRVDPAALSSYAALADPEWHGRICIRSSTNVYNQSLLASIIAHEGAAAAEAWAAAMVANLARKPQGGDRDQIKAAAAGECDIAVANTYYYARMVNSSKESERAAAAKVALFWPDQDGTGAHVNVSGAAVTRSSRNKDNAIRLIEFLAGETAQRIYAEQVYEFPVRPGVPLAPTVAAWGSFRADTIGLSALGAHQAEAVRIFDRVGWR